MGPTRGGLANGATRPLFLFWGHIPQAPWEGAPPPPLPSLIKVGAGRPFSKRLTSVGVNGGHPHAPRHGGFAPWTPICPPPLAEGLPAFWVPLVGRLLMGQRAPSFEFVGGHPPHPPARELCPLDPRLPAPVGFGFASVLGPTRGWLTSPPAPPRSGKGRTPPNFPPSLAGKGGHPPRPPPWGLRPPGPPVCPPS